MPRGREERFDHTSLPSLLFPCDGLLSVAGGRARWVERHWLSVAALTWSGCGLRVAVSRPLEQPSWGRSEEEETSAPVWLERGRGGGQKHVVGLFAVTYLPTYIKGSP